MTQRTKAWSVAVAATVTLLAAAIFGISASLMVPTVKGPDAPPPLRWRDLTAPRPQQ
jgi:hypothetical protein